MKRAIRIEVWQKYSRKCAYCGIELDYKDMQVDHIHPKFFGGTDAVENLNPSCRMCNFYKNSFTIEQFREQLSLIQQRINKQFIYRLGKRYGLIKETNKKITFYFEEQ